MDEAENLALIARDIETARGWLETRFPQHRDEELPLLFQAGFVIEYPGPDRAIVRPTIFGKEMDGAEVGFRLCWQGRGLYWKGNFEIRKAVYSEGNIIEHYVGPATGSP
jgi:hypothetical protein